MKKQVRKILSALLVLTMLLSTLPAAVYAEAGDVEPIATPTVEPIEEPIVETIATPVPEATEEPNEEPIIEVTAEPAGEPVAEPVVESAEEPAAMPAAPAELTDAQLAALNALPAGFSAQVVAAAMLSSNSCAHTVFYVYNTWAEETYTRIDDENHRYTGKIIQKKLVCESCNTTLQTISVNEVYDEVYGHDWVMDIDSSSPYDFVCSSCGAKKRFTSACSHTNVYQGEDGNLHCKDCGAITYVFEKNECEHKNITIIQPDTVLTWYDQWDANKHVKYTTTWHYDDTSYVDAECDDCGISIICDRNGNNRSYGTTDTAGDYTNEKSTLEAHSFENGVCAQCGYKQSETDPDTCDHSAGNYNDVLDTDVAPVYSNITAESHCVQYSYKRYCKDCNAYIGNVTDEGITPVPHDFGTGDTCACGYKKAETPEDAPYVRGFTMSASTIKLGETVTFTLDIANAQDGETLKIEMCADDQYSVSPDSYFTVTKGKVSYTHEFTVAGNRSIKFRVVGGEYCAAQTLIVEASKAGIDSAKLSISNLSVVEKAEGETIRATVICNNQTGVAELYVGSAKNYASSDDYDVVDGRRVFEVEVTLGGNGKSYAGDYKIWVNALKGAYQAVDATYNLGTLKVTHAYTAQSEPAGSYYEKSANGHTLYNKTKITETCSVCGDQKETTQKKPAGNEEPHVGLTENGKCSVCGYAKGKLKINEDVVIGENGRMKIASKAAITTPHYYLDAGTISENPEDLVRVIRQFDVMNNYKPTQDSNGNWTTYCNFFASNVARAMGAYMPGPGDLICQNCYGIVSISNDYTGWNEIVNQKDLRCSCGAKRSVSVAFPVINKTSWDQVGHSPWTNYGDLTRWFIEKSKDFGWEAINDYTVENYANITDNTPSLRADTIDKAKEYANKGYLVIGVRSDWICSSKNNQQSGHIFVVHPNSDTSKLYTVQAGGQSAMRENRPDGNGTRSSDNGWNAFFVFTGKDL